MIKFEYTTETIKLGGTILSKHSVDNKELTAILNRFGSEGWELTEKIDIQLNGWTKSITLVFKRQIS